MGILEKLLGKKKDRHDAEQMQSIRMFLAKMPYCDVYLSAQKAFAKFGSNEYAAFKYFCGICWRIIKGDDDAKS